MTCSFTPLETSTTSETATSLLSSKQARNKPVLLDVDNLKEEQNSFLFAKDGSLKFMQFLKFLQDNNYIQNFLSAWFGLHCGREVFHAGVRDRLFLEDSRHLYDYVQECECLGLPAWMSVHPFKKRAQVYGLEKLYFDFDCKENLVRAWKEARDFALKIEKFYEAKSLLVFSGCKGFHLYVWLWKTIEFRKGHEKLTKDIYKELQKKLLKGLHYTTLDPQVLGDIKRLARIPYSRHEETGHICLPLTMNIQPLQILPSALEGYRKNGLGPGIFHSVVKQVQKKSKKRPIRVNKVTFRFFNRRVRPCIENALETDLNKKHGHLMRLAIAAEFLNQGSTVEDVVQLFSSQTDFGNGEKSRYFVKDAQAKGYKPFKCETLQTLGFCLGASCPIFRRKETTQLG